MDSQGPSGLWKILGSVYMPILRVGQDVFKCVKDKSRQIVYVKAIRRQETGSRYSPSRGALRRRMKGLPCYYAPVSL